MHEREALGIVFLISLSCVNVSRGTFINSKSYLKNPAKFLHRPGTRRLQNFFPKIHHFDIMTGQRHHDLFGLAKQALVFASVHAVTSACFGNYRSVQNRHDFPERFFRSVSEIGMVASIKCDSSPHSN